MPKEKPRWKQGDAESGKFATADAARALRERAQAAARETDGHLPEDVASLSPESARALVHELQVHQIELELQNEELRRAQEELEASRTRYFDMYDLAPVGYVTVGENGRVLEANLAAAALLALPRGELVQQPLTRFIFAEDQDTYFKHQKGLKVRSPHSCELRLVKGSGEAFWVQLEARVGIDAAGAYIARMVLSDITARKHAEQTLAASESRHRILFENSRDALMTLAPPSWQFTRANAATLKMFGAADPARFLTRTLWSCSPARQADGRLSEEKGQAMIGLALQKGYHSFDWICLRAPAEAFRATVGLVRLEANGVPMLHATLRDETHLEQERVSAAQTERLASMGLVAASVGHEINNPLAYVLSNLESLAEMLPPPASEQIPPGSPSGTLEHPASNPHEDAVLLDPTKLQMASELTRDALDGARRITRISRVLSTFSRADAPELREVDLQAAIESAISIAFNEIRFRAEMVTELGVVPAVWASEGKLSQVFLNLLVNAAHAIGEKAGEQQRITVRTWAENGQVFAEVKDTGKGIAPENLAKVFEPFFTTKEVGVGSGLGLSICRNIVAEFGGDIRVESELGKGTLFVVRLRAAAAGPRQSEAFDDEVPQAIPRGRVLIIDDEELLRTMMKRLLVDHEVVIASSGSAARALLEHDLDFDVILCDLMMPEVSGVDVHRWLTQHAPSVAKRLVFVTGGAFGQVAAEYVENSGNLKLEKPFDNRSFKDLVASLVQDGKRDRRSGIKALGKSEK